MHEVIRIIKTMENKKSTFKNNLNKFTYFLFYPAILGSMLYESLPDNKLDLDYLLKLSIILYYCIDYWHLYFYLNKKVKLKYRSWTYIWGDIAVSTALFCSMKYYDSNPSITIICFLIIPFCFLLYNLPIRNNSLFHKIYLCCSILIGVCYFVLSLPYFTLGEDFFTLILRAFVYLSTITYLIYALIVLNNIKFRIKSSN